MIMRKNEALEAEEKYKSNVEKTAEYVEFFDILETITNVGNDEVFTPRKVVDRMLDSLPEEVWHNPDYKWLNPATKTGIFEREIAIRLDEGLKDEIRDVETRRKHILQNMIFSIGQTKFTANVARRTLYYCCQANRPCDGIMEDGHYVNGYAIGNGTWFDDAEGNVKTPCSDHVIRKGKCIHCGILENSKYLDANQREKYSYDFIHCSPGDDLQTFLANKFFKGDRNVKFDVIIGNPPYQLSDGGNGASAMPIYQKFVMQAKSLNPKYISMIIPARWYAGGKGLDEFRADMLKDSRIELIFDYSNSADCFTGLNIAGGVCYFLWNNDYRGDCIVSNIKNDRIISQDKRRLNEFPLLIRDNNAVHIVRKVMQNTTSTMDRLVFSRNIFKLPSNFKGESIQKEDSLSVLSSKGTGYVSSSELGERERELSQKFNVIITYAMSGGNKPSSDGDYQVISSLQIIQPGTIFTETYLCLGSFDNLDQARSLYYYMSTKFVRFLLLQSLSSIHITKDCFCFVPIQDWNSNYTDTELYAKYNLSKDEITCIENAVKEMSL